MNDGKDLENLAALIESVQLPEGFLIERNLKPRDEYGNQIAELDVVISGRIGSTPFKMLIECRDRPSDGSAPGSWIEQLATRKRRFDFNTVIAVSSTGFAPGAPQLAEDENIILRTMNELTPDDVSSHIPFFCPIVMNEPKIKSIAVHLETTPNSATEPIPLNLDTLIFNETDNTEFSVADLCAKTQHRPRLFDGVKEDGVEVEKAVTLQPPEVDGWHIRLNDENHKIMRVDFTLGLKAYWLKMPMVSVKEYQASDLKDDTSIAEVAHWQGEDTDMIKELKIILWRKREIKK